MIPKVIRPIMEREEHSHVSMLKRDLVSVLDLEISCLMVDPKIRATGYTLLGEAT